jgi:hypothetical protein
VQRFDELGSRLEHEAHGKHEELRKAFEKVPGARIV